MFPSAWGFNSVSEGRSVLDAHAGASDGAGAGWVRPFAGALESYRLLPSATHGKSALLSGVSRRPSVVSGWRQTIALANFDELVPGRSRKIDVRHWYRTTPGLRLGRWGWLSSRCRLSFCCHRASSRQSPSIQANADEGDYRQRDGAPVERSALFRKEPVVVVPRVLEVHKQHGKLLFERVRQASITTPSSFVPGEEPGDARTVEELDVPLGTPEWHGGEYPGNDECGERPPPDPDSMWIRRSKQEQRHDDGEGSPQDAHGLEVIGACGLQLGSELIPQDVRKDGIEMGQRAHLPGVLGGRRTLPGCRRLHGRLVARSHACAPRFVDPRTTLSPGRLSLPFSRTTPVSDTQRSLSSFW